MTNHTNKKGPGILYVKVSKTASVTTPEITLGQVADLAMLPKGDTKKWEKLILQPAPKGRKKSVVLSALALRKALLEKEPGLLVVFLGAEDVVVECHKASKGISPGQVFKTILVSVVSFVGGAFAIMTFNQDVELGKIFQRLYLAITGEVSRGMTILEASYSLGIFLGMVLFFNHFARWKLTEDPTPLEVQLCQYENQVADAVIKYNKEQSSSEEVANEAAGQGGSQ